jgi:uncharacterized membrane protein YfcA
MEALGQTELEAFWPALPILLLAGLVHGTFGIGFPMVATPLLALFTDVRTAVLLTLLPTVAVNLSVLLRGRGQGARIGPHWRVVPFVLAGAALGSGLLMWLDPRPFLLVLATAILLYLNQERLSGLDLGWVRERPLPAYALFGTLAGVMAGSVNVMVPVLIILALELRLPALSMVQLFNLNFLSAKLVQILVFVSTGLLTLALLAHTLLLVPVAMAGLFLGMALRRRISEERYRSVLRGLLWLMAAILLGRFLLA